MILHYPTVLSTPLGKIGVAFKENKLSRLELLPDSAEITQGEHPLSQPVSNELLRYFNDPTYVFKLDMYLSGTPFQLRVWQALQTIPSGQTLTYGSLAKQLKTGPRAIGQACRTNPLPIVIPCHRIVGSNHLGGYSGARQGKWLEVKTWLLQHEGVTI